MKPSTLYIPERLRNPTFRFCLVRKQQKAAYEPNWQAGRPYNDPVLNSLLCLKANYGVITHHGGLAILDLDNTDSVRRIEPLLPATFTVRTAKGKHYYFHTTPDARKIVLQDGPTHHGELQAGEWFYVVGPGSTHPSGVKYEIERDLPIATIAWDELKRILAPFVTTNNKTVPVAKPTTTRPRLDINLRIEDVIHLPSNPYQGPHPFHGSDTGKNFTVDGDKWFCFRHNVGGGPLQLLAIKEGIISCDQAGPGALRGEDYLATIGSIEVSPRG